MLPTIHEEQEIDDDPMAIPFYPFGEVLVKNQTRRRSKSDYVYGALFYIVMLALAFAVTYNDVYLYQPEKTSYTNCSTYAKSTIHTNSTNLKIDKISSAPLGWIPQALASIIIGQTIAWATLYFSCGSLQRFPSLTFTLDVATLVISLRYCYGDCFDDQFANLVHYVLVIGPVVASFFLLGTMQPTLADDKGAAMVPANIVSGAQAHDTETCAERFETYRDRGCPRFMMRLLAWMTFLRLTFLSWYFADRIINLLNYDGFFDHYMLTVPFIIVLSAVVSGFRYLAYVERREERAVRSSRVEVPNGVL